MKNKLYRILSVITLLTGITQAQDHDDPTGGAPVHSTVTITKVHHHSSSCLPSGHSVARGAVKTVEYTGRGLGSIVCGTLGAAGGVVVGTGLSLVLLFPIKVGCFGVYGLHTELNLAPPFYYGAKGGVMGVKACW